MTSYGCRGIGFWLLAAALGLAGGCNLADYEAKIKLEQERLKYLDDEASFLGEPIKLPSPPKGEEKSSVLPREIFFRPPKGIGDKPADPRSAGTPAWLHKFPSFNQRSAVHNVYVAVSKTMSEPDFQKQVLNYFRVSSSLTRKSFTNAAARRTLQFSTATVSEANKQLVTEIYFHKDRNFNAAIVFEIALADSGRRDSAANQAVRFSLQSLALGPSAARQLEAFRSLAGSSR